MKKILYFCAIMVEVSFMMTMTSCLAETTPGEEVVFYKNPWIFGKGGTDTTSLTEGSEWYWPTTSIYRIKNIPIMYDEEFPDIFSKDNVPLKITAHAQLQVTPGMAWKLISLFGENWYNNDIKEPFREVVRNEICRHPMDQLTVRSEIYDSVKYKIKSVINHQILSLGLPVQCIQVIVDKATPHEDVMAEYNRTATQLQADKTQKAAAKMQDSRKLAEEKRADADRAYMTKMGLTGAQYIQLRSQEIEKEKIEMVKGKDDNVTITMLMGGDAVPTWEVPNGRK
jgi:hypothetical protein